MKAELKHLDRKYSEKHQWYYAETVEDKAVPDQVDWWTKYALCVTRYMSQDGKNVNKVVVQINSQHLKDLLKEAIGSYPGVSLDTKDIALTQPCRLLYHYLDEIKALGEKFEAGSEAAAHYQVLLNHIQEEFGETIQEANNLREQNVMSYQHLWTVFKPKTIAFARVLGQVQAFRVLDSHYQCGQNPRLVLQLQQVDFDGKRFGHRNEQMGIPAYLGAVGISKLNVVPRLFFPQVEEVEQALIARGRRFEQYAGIHFAEHAAIALEHVYNSARGDYDINRVHISERVVIDCLTHHRLNPDLAKSVYDSDNYDSDDDESPKRLDAELMPTAQKSFKPLTDEQCLLASALVHGFSFTHKKWIDMFIDELSPVQWNEQCFDQLVLAPRQKKLVQALVTEHICQKSDFDDIIKGKGKGLVLVLHGPPGVGKTLTAECVAERCKRPLYVVSSGDLGTDSFTLDQRLTQILDMASTWRAVLLIDEADVFLERRSLHDMERNALVSIFLRVLEYYQGILFLTSNRVDTFDDAFKSRIHVPLKYTGLDTSSRKQIWKNFLDKAEGGEEGSVVDEEGLDKLAVHDLNGRQIKGIVRTATSLARYDSKKLDLETLEQVVEIQMDFERDLVGDKQ
ncbi:P-loop containing nucleoside triphosphate hydrolase protein [Aureobasidium melanogenum CBS 110374]|uniref:p-loop containing nucleoside triphosphate hydrolase protein n=1 Tax=Aureobasidium melanogenum (strain CBS 110374) TaxID=1043003 RepID=A0A074VLY7_AURM1|nr:P-loop containing nucleoside triphosphate hydrolase protein [Aureobasidium melanogenum CBS 110374]KEQ61730.1 P-loop containing nucleoside triphosphate hydrolase protein [Aureobasidium melanogenum CBS 110374]